MQADSIMKVCKISCVILCFVWGPITTVMRRTTNDLKLVYQPATPRWRTGMRSVLICPCVLTDNVGLLQVACSHWDLVLLMVSALQRGKSPREEFHLREMECSRAQRSTRWPSRGSTHVYTNSCQDFRYFDPENETLSSFLSDKLVYPLCI